MEENLKANKRTASIVGILFLAAIVAYATGNALMESVLSSPDYLSQVTANRIPMAAGALAMLINSIVVVGIGVLMLPILKPHHQNIAYFYFSFRLVEAIVLMVGIGGMLTIITIGQQYEKAANPNAAYFQVLADLAKSGNYFAYQMAMAVLGLSSLPFCYVLYQSRLVPRFLSVWGFVGYAIFMVGAILEILGFGLGLMLSIPGGLFELVFGFWLIIRGFNATPLTK